MSGGTEVHRLSAVELTRRVSARELSVRRIAEGVLERIAALDGDLKAWVYLDSDAVLAEAGELDRGLAAGNRRGPLYGLPVGVKDIIDVAGVPTRAGSRARSDAAPASVDSAVVASLRAAGALIVGKTATTEFAYAEPAATRNPWNLEYEPGGSSSGSAASVAAHMVPAALGTQTAGSVLRPAAFCGDVGFKPSFGRIDRRGVIPCAWSLDTIGTLTHTVDDAALLAGVLIDGARHTGSELMLDRPPRVGYVPRILADRVQPAVGAAVSNVADRLAHAGARVDEASLPSDFAVSLHAHHVIMVAEAAAYHAEAVAKDRERYGERLRQLVDTGQLVRGADYLRAQRVRHDLFERVVAVFNRCDALLVPAAAGTAPLKREGHTGAPSFNAPWTMFGLPAITFCGGLSAEGLPLGVQLVGRPGADEELLRVAAWCERALGPAPSAPAPFA